MKISPYSISFAGELIHGAVVTDGRGYAVLQSWPQLGDPPLEKLLADLRFGRSLALVQRACELIEIDAHARQAGVSLLPASVPPTHELLNIGAITVLSDLKSALARERFLFKIKIGRSVAAEIATLKTIEREFAKYPYRIRLDANLRFARPEMDEFLSSFSDDFLCRIEFIEDPIVGDARAWRAFKEKWGIKIAHDFAPAELRTESDVWIVKPSRENPWPLVERATHEMKRIVVTTALDHELGQMVAVSEAGRIAEAHPLLIDACGVPSQFERLRGTGFGCDTILSELEWHELKANGVNK